MLNSINQIGAIQNPFNSPLVIKEEKRGSIQGCFSKMALRVYEIWFRINKFVVEAFKSISLPALGVTLGMLLLEGHTLCKAARLTFFKYRKEPEAYGLQQIKNCYQRKNPVLLFHGAAGSWNYLGDLALELSKAGIPVFVMNLGGGDATEEKRKLVCRKIEQIRVLYSKKPKVDLIAHSMGSNLAIAAAFSTRCSSINEQGELTFRKRKSIRSHSSVGKVITIANPSNQGEFQRISQAGKSRFLFNINAKYDALMGHKTCALTGRYASQTKEIDAGHVGIVFQPETFGAVKQFLS